MRKAEIDALIHAHRGRPRPVAFFHVLRQPALEADDHAFLLEHADELGISDLLRWRARCEPGTTGPLVRHLADRAVKDPKYFQHEVLDLPRIDLDDDEWRELADRVRGRVPTSLYDGIVAKGGARPVRPPPSFYFTPGKLDRSGLDPGDLDEAAAGDPSRGIDSLTIRQLLLARAKGTVTIDDAALAALALERARSSDEDWSRASAELPPSLLDAVLEKVRSTPRTAERANLLSWLEAREVPRATLFPIALAPSPELAISSGLVTWLARALGTRAAWEKHGLATISALMNRGAFPEIGEIITLAYGAAEDAGRDRARALLDAVQVEFALALCAATRAAIEGGDRPRAAAALSALACLDPPSRVSRAVHELRALAGDGDLGELCALNERLVKHGDGRDASLEGVVAALHAVADAFG